MFALTTSHRFQLYSEATDMRKGFDGLCAIVDNNLNQDVTSSGVYVFINKRRDKIKLLHWAGSGFVLYYKRLEKGTFEFPKYYAKDSDLQRSEYVLELIKSVYKIERIIDEGDFSDEQILGQRASALELLNELKDWMDEEIMKVRPKRPIGKAMAYALNQWSKLLAYTKYPQMKIGNNRIENTIRPVALGRKNYLFAGSHHAAQRAAMIYSFL